MPIIISRDGGVVEVRPQPTDAQRQALWERIVKNWAAAHTDALRMPEKENKQ